MNATFKLHRVILIASIAIIFCVRLEGNKQVYVDLTDTLTVKNAAIDLGVDGYFQARMQNEKYNKIAFEYCDILYMDSVNVYYGYQRNGKAIRDKIFCVERDKLEKALPNYSELNGWILKHQMISRIKWPPKGDWFSTSTEYKYALTDSTIQMRVKMTHRRAVFLPAKRKFWVFSFDTNDFDMIEYWSSSKDEYNE